MDLDMLMAPLILFMIFVAPLWVLMHYRSKRQVSEGLTEIETRQLRDLAERADQMAKRIQTLEAILDAESPQWRNKA